MMEMNKDGIVFLNKKTGETSFQSLGCVKRTLGTKKVGHTGTLDKFASGLLIVLTGRFTKLNSLITGMDKVYVADFKFGLETDTLDPEGQVIAEASLPDEDLIRKTMDTFRGEIEQCPPLYSAIHIDGQRAHKLARKGIDREMPSRPVKIYAFDFLSYNEGVLKVRIHCSKGTYVRSLARDLGIACGSRAYVTRLERTEIGPFKLEESVTGEIFREKASFYPWRDFLQKLPHTAVLTVTDEAIPLIANGVPFKPVFLLEPSGKPESLTALIKQDGQIVALLSAECNGYKYKINFS